MPTNTKVNQSEWKTIGVKVRHTELMLLNKQLDRLNYTTLGELVKDLMSGKITRLTDDQQIEIMKTNLQTNGQSTGLSGKPYDFYKQVDITDLQNIFRENISGTQLRVTLVILKNMLAYSLDQALMQNCLSSRLLKDLGYFKQSRDLVIFILKDTIIGKSFRSSDK